MSSTISPTPVIDQIKFYARLLKKKDLGSLNNSLNNNNSNNNNNNQLYYQNKKLKFYNTIY